MLPYLTLLLLLLGFHLGHLNLKNHPLHTVRFLPSSVSYPSFIPIFLGLALEGVLASPFNTVFKPTAESVPGDESSIENSLTLGPNPLEPDFSEEVKAKLIELTSLKQTLEAKLNSIKEIQSGSFQLPEDQLTPDFFLSHYDYFLNQLEILLAEKKVASEYLLPTLHLRPSEYQAELQNYLFSIYEIFSEHQKVTHLSIFKLTKLFFCQYLMNTSHIVKLRPYFQQLEKLSIVQTNTIDPSTRLSLNMEDDPTPTLKWVFHVSNPSFVVNFSTFLNTWMTLKNDIHDSEYSTNNGKKFMHDILNYIQDKWKAKYKELNLSCRELLHIYLWLKQEKSKLWFIKSDFGSDLKVCQIKSWDSLEYVIHLHMYKRAYTDYEKLN